MKIALSIPTIICISSLINAYNFNSAQAQALDSASQEALQKTNDLLKDKKQREEFIKTDSQAQKANQYANEVAGSPENTQKVYDLSAQIFERLVKKYNGDVDKIKTVIEKAQKDPKGFAESEFNEGDLKALKELSRQLSGAQTLPN